MPIPPPPPELFDWLMEILKGLCPAPVAGSAFDRVKRFGLLDQLKVQRGLAQKYRDAGLGDEWKRNKGEIMAQVRDAAREATPDDVKSALED